MDSSGSGPEIRQFGDNWIRESLSEITTKQKSRHWLSRDSLFKRQSLYNQQFSTCSVRWHLSSVSLMVDPNQAHRELARGTTFMGLHTSDHRHRRRRLSCFVLDGIKVAFVPLPHHSPVWHLVLTVLAQVRLSRTLYYCGLEECGSAPNQAFSPRGGWHQR